MGGFLRNVRDGYNAGRGRTGRAVVPYSNERDAVQPYSSGRQYHRRIFAPTARIEVEKTPYGSKTTYYLDDGYREEIWWEEE
jgi:hypothetical protein